MFESTQEKQRPSAPLLEMGFYFRTGVDADAYGSVVRELVKRGARYRFAEGYTGAGCRLAAFETIHDTPLEARVDFNGGADVESLLADPNLRITTTSFEYDIPRTGAPVEVTYNSLPGGLGPQEPHPIALLASGTDFDGPLTEQALATGDKVYDRFVELADSLSPLYGAIAVEAPLPAPGQLGRFDSTAFWDFYIDHTLAVAPAVKSLLDTINDAYLERRANGIYVSMSKAFNPHRMEVANRKALGLLVEELLAVALQGT